MSYVLWKLKGKILSCEIGKVRGIKAILNAVKLRKLKKNHGMVVRLKVDHK
jgi:hypothetical protein